MEFVAVNSSDFQRNLKLFDPINNICASSNNGSFNEYFKEIKNFSNFLNGKFLLFYLKEEETIKAIVMTNKAGMIIGLFVEDKDINVTNFEFIKLKLVEVFKGLNVKRMTIYLKQKGLNEFNAIGFRNLKCICDMEQRTNLSAYCYLLEFNF